ncbi:AAA domain-containing protein [Nitrospirillum amazonense]|nr:AAA domain-containing protein [Nitrospirillum amazonense]MDG3442580.1 AAA domain-containing protein [Nitrospirillum amazonense]
MAFQLPALLRYWRAALLDSLRLIDPQSLDLLACSREALAQGRIDGNALTEIWHKAETGLSDKEKKELQTVAVVIAPQVLEPEKDHSDSYSTLKRYRVPLWLYGRVNREGLLQPTNDPPLVDRAVMMPLASAVPVFTTVEALDSHLDNNRPPEAGSDWAAVWGYAMAMCDSLFGGRPGAWVPDRYVDQQTAFVALGKPPVDTTSAIRAVYEVLIDTPEEAPPLLARLAAPPPPREITNCLDVETARAARHLGEMGGAFPLNPSQRQALGAFLALADGDVLALNGPPGTGKTTFIQSAVASIWVESALVDGGEPPVILASSTNNKAITNILDCFERAALPDGHALSGSHLVRRWLPDLTQYGLYLPSQREVKNGLRTGLAAAWCPQNGQPWAGLPGAMETQDYINRAEPHWRAQFTQWAGKSPANMAEAVATLRAALTAKVEAVKALEPRRAAAQAMVGAYGAVTAEAIKALRLQAATLRRQMDELRQHGGHAVHLVEGSLIESLLSWLPPVKRRLWMRAYGYLEVHGLADPAWDWDTVLDATSLRRWLAERIRLVTAAMAANTAALSAWDCWVAAVADLLPTLPPEAALASASVVDAALDTQVRPELFHLAGRYWEGRWLIEVGQALERNDKTFTGRSRDVCERRWRRFAKLTPCLVSTAFTAPRLLDYYNGDTRRLFSFIDLLIVDEAGQVPPQVGACLFAFARKALVVGDTLQLEPVWGVNADIDGGNLALFQLDGDALRGAGMLASEGSMMAMAQSATTFSAKPHQGLFLEEHWRCRKPVIAYCNELAYRGRLRPMREDAPYPLPPLGYAHVRGRPSRSGLSRINADEAMVIANWLKRRRKALLDQHGVTVLGAIVAIVTPFKAQISILSRALSAAGLDGDDITVGTVHTLQGAERDIVLFSPVYGADDGTTGGLFFDRGVNMLNVAVSRARQSFLVFGDLRLFNPSQPSLPSGLLARHLFSAPENEIADIDPVGGIAARPLSDLERLSDLATHCSTLRQAITEVRERLLVISPYLSHAAIEADGLAPLLASRRGGPKIVVAYDADLNSGAGQKLYPRAAKALEMLGAAGVELWALTGAHNKTLAVDDQWIVEGSFNWLSAVRQQDSIYHRHEVSLLYRGREASTHVDSAWREAEQRRKN